ncbi:MAG: hypothetical protein LBH51_07410 [Treponema sp.]|nr:hypothetical protein [Treponema sp.]
MTARILPALFAAALILAPAAAGALSLEELSGPEAAAELRAGKTLSRVQLKDPRPALVPRHGEIAAFAAEILAELETGVMVESLSLYEKPPSASRPAWSDVERTALLNSLLAVSSLAGIQYYSASRGSMRTFYEYSRIIDSPESRRELADPFYAAPPAELRFYARQRDLTFGDNIYEYRYRAGGDFLVLVQRNLTDLKVSIVPAVGKDKLRSLAAVIDAGDSLLFYALSLARAAAFPGLGNRIGNSLTNRAQAVLGWFGARSDAAFQAARRP